MPSGHSTSLAAAIFGLAIGLRSANPFAAELAETIARIKPSIVGIGTFQQTRSPPAVFFGTGFVVGEGRQVITNAHVVAREPNAEAKESLIVLTTGSGEARNRPAQIVRIDRGRDLALLQIEGPALPALDVADSSGAREGQALAFTGFPVGMALGLFPATHRATLAAIVPIARPGINGRQLNAPLVARLRDSPYVVFQLDGTAYPGNSGSPLYDPATGKVYGIVNSVFVQGTREQAISRPSGITYAIPSVHILALLQQARLGAGR